VTDKPRSLGELPVIEKTLPCLRCAANTTHKLSPSDKGCAWVCVSCQNSIHAFTFDQMVNVVTQKVFGLSRDATPVNIPQGLRVFLEYSGEGATEKEASRLSVEAHVKATGRLPMVGKPLFASPIPGMAVPYGKVVRVEINEQGTRD
jgi:hypothetical protein